MTGSAAPSGASADAPVNGSEQLGHFTIRALAEL
jgi:hypothetical protein